MAERIKKAENCVKVIKLNCEGIENLKDAVTEFAPAGSGSSLDKADESIFADQEIVHLTEKKLKAKVCQVYSELQNELYAADY